MKRILFDIETNNLLSEGLDYSTLPLKLRSDYYLWCIVFRDLDSDKVIHLSLSECTKENVKDILKDCTELSGHNIVNFDLPVLKLFGVLDYTVGYPGESSTLFGRDVKITDTLVWSKLLNPDRFGGHSLAEWGRRLGNYKQDFHAFDQYTEEMLEYCIQDTNTNKTLYYELLKEKGNFDWETVYEMELKLVDLTLKQELFGMDFDKELAERNLVELDKLMQERAEKVNPILPKKQMNKGTLSNFTPPKVQLKKDGSPSAALLRFAERVGASVLADMSLLVYKGNQYILPHNEPLETEEVATIDDLDTVKGYLLSLGWVPSEVKERDLVKNANKTTKNKDQIVETIDRYVEQTRNSVFCELRCDLLGVSIDNLQKELYNRIDGTKPIYVPTSPKLQVGVEKEICPNLIKMGEKAEFVKHVCEYYTYRHRRNSIAGGTVDEDGEPTSGFLSYVREDGRIPTPADTLGANTGRYRHKIVCNIPRVTSLFGEPMRNQFGCGKGLYQLGFDFASLEARVQGHYCLPYTDGQELADSLVAEKPNDIHSVNARKLGIDRSSAKSFSYACMYGAQPKKLSKMLGITEGEGKRLFNAYWEAVPALKELKDKLEAHWNQNGKTWVLGLDGRKIMSRSKHSLINVLFQSGGAIVAKWSTVLIAKDLESKGILGNPFEDKYTDPKVWMMIAMHDEVQYAVHPSLMSIKVFEDEDSAKNFKEDLCSAVGHGVKGPYVGLATEPVFSIDSGIKEACAHLKTRVPMGFEWIPGKSWGQCH